MKKRNKWLIFGGVVLLVGGFLVYAFLRPGSNSVTYQNGTTTKGSLFFTVSSSGTMAAANKTNVNASVSGTVSELDVKLGDTVVAGQKLFVIKNDQLDLSVNQAYASYLQSKQALQQANVSLLQAQNNQTTVNSNDKSTDVDKNIAAQQVVTAQMGVTDAKQGQANAWQSYQYQLTQAGNRVVTAPMAGTITTLSINAGDTVSGGGVSSGGTGSSSNSSSAAISIQDMGSLVASLSINEVDAPSIKAGQKVSLTFDAISGLTATGQVMSMDNVGTSTSGVVTYTATVKLDTIDQRIKPGMTISGVITTSVEDNVLYVPNSAVKTASDGSYYVQTLDTKTNKASNITVEIGDANSSDTVIKSGLSEGQSIITSTITKSVSTSSSSSAGSALRSLSGGGGGGFGGSGTTTRTGTSTSTPTSQGN